MGHERRRSADDAALAVLAARQEGLLRRADLMAHGMGRQAITHRVRTHRLFLHHPGIYSLHPGPYTNRTAWLAAQWWCGGDAVLSHMTAGAFHGHGPEPDPGVVHVTTTLGKGSRPGVVVHRSAVLDRLDWAQHGLLRVTNRSRTLVDEAATLPFPLFRARVDGLKELPVDALEATLLRAPERPGGTAVRRVLHGDGRHTRSELERRYRRFCRAFGIPLPSESNVWIAGHLADCVYRRERLVVELDGRAYHERRGQLTADRLRDADYQLATFRILRLVWWSFEPEEAAATAALLRRFLDAAP